MAIIAQVRSQSEPKVLIIVEKENHHHTIATYDRSCTK
jgi:hypothetical protein